MVLKKDHQPDSEWQHSDVISHQFNTSAFLRRTPPWQDSPKKRGHLQGGAPNR